MTNKQFTKFAEGIISGLTTMEDLRNNKSSLFETYPVLVEGDNWNNLVIYARANGLQPVCNHIRVVRSVQDVINILAGRYIDNARTKRYDSIGALKYWHGLINTYCKVEGNTFGWGDIKKEWTEYVKGLVKDNYDNALRDYNYNSAIIALVNLFKDSKEWREIIVASVGANLLNMDNPVQFVQNWYSYTDMQGNLLVQVPYISKDGKTITCRWEYKELKRQVAQSCLEDALRNVKKAFSAGKLEKKYTPLQRYSQGDFCGKVWEAKVNDKGKVVRGDEIAYHVTNDDFSMTLADYNREFSK